MRSIGGVGSLLSKGSFIKRGGAMDLIDGLYEKQHYSDVLLGFCTECHTCRDAAQMCATGNMFKKPGSDLWMIEFYCSSCKETMRVHDRRWRTILEKAVTSSRDVV